MRFRADTAEILDHAPVEVTLPVRACRLIRCNFDARRGVSYYEEKGATDSRMLGETIGHYRLLAELGSGGMGIRP
jgi:hypothetical protein